MNDKFRKIWKEAVVAESLLRSWQSLSWLRNSLLFMDHKGWRAHHWPRPSTNLINFTLPTLYFFQIHFIIVLPSTSVCSKGSLPFRFPIKILYAFLISPKRAICPVRRVFFASESKRGSSEHEAATFLGSNDSKNSPTPSDSSLSLSPPPSVSKNRVQWMTMPQEIPLP
jgi:hypothetical protein